MACDGDIANEEVDLIKKYVRESELFGNINVEELLNCYVEDINSKGVSYLNNFIKEIKDAELNEEQELNIVRISIKMIEADNIIQYSEVKFFKRIRQYLHIEDEVILKEMPGKEDYLLPDISVNEYEFTLPNTFSTINLNLMN